MMSTCIFCAIVAGHKPSRPVMGNDRALAFLDINPVPTDPRSSLRDNMRRTSRRLAMMQGSTYGA